MGINYFRGEFIKNGMKKVVEATSQSKKASILAKEVKEKMKKEGFKYLQGGMGTKSK